MIGKTLGRAAVAASFLVAASVASADEIVSFTNGAEMPVKSHTIEKDMVKLDLGPGSTISFPLNMVTKIAAAGQEVFVNPNYKPVNQAVAGSVNAMNGGSQPVPVESRMITGGGGTTGFRQRPGGTDAGGGLMYGEPAIGEGDSQKFVRVNGTTGRPDPRHPFLSTVTRPVVDTMNPIPFEGQGVIAVPNQASAPHPHQPIILRPPDSASSGPATPPAPAPPPPPPPAPEDNPPASSDPGTQGSDPSN
jgi:hypothetical protein